MPLPMVALPWGSRSINSTRFLSAASAAARLTAVVVFPTPPFWLAIQKIRALAGFLAMSRHPVTLNRRVYRKPLVMTPARSGASQIRNTALGIHAGHLDRLQFLQSPL